MNSKIPEYQEQLQSIQSAGSDYHKCGSILNKEIFLQQCQALFTPEFEFISTFVFKQSSALSKENLKQFIHIQSNILKLPYFSQLDLVFYNRLVFLGKYYGDKFAVFKQLLEKAADMNINQYHLQIKICDNSQKISNYPDYLSYLPENDSNFKSQLLK